MPTLRPFQAQTGLGDYQGIVELNASRAAWVVLDEAEQVLLRAESIVPLLGIESDAPKHHAYAADLLRSLKKKLSGAQEIVWRTDCALHSVMRSASALSHKG